MQDPQYFEAVVKQFPTAHVEYLGFVDTVTLGRILGNSRALLVTPKWIEAFGNVAVEALACGCPVIAYKRGGPQEIVEEGKSGLIVPADDVDALVSAIGRVQSIDRSECRRRAEAEYSQAAMGDRVLAWFHLVLAHASVATSTPLAPPSSLQP
eukprot:CAMPEP_0196668452 /NCGR_PEP_ID=MMETSP1086-20130531/65628_1 /TAXON_ID=77921 /ORGANISM="Cyanoptyche  gloeocystis , Strain SAG4.97" /LENGTH=152 /DNA_ID=CAMNT_0042005861 /DNA_START=1 /DNA_END=459 /DNA_ORIENTATION=-